MYWKSIFLQLHFTFINYCYVQAIIGLKEEEGMRLHVLLMTEAHVFKTSNNILLRDPTDVNRSSCQHVMSLNISRWWKHWNGGNWSLVWKTIRLVSFSECVWYSVTSQAPCMATWVNPTMYNSGSVSVSVCHVYAKTLKQSVLVKTNEWKGS